MVAFPVLLLLLTQPLFPTASFHDADPGRVRGIVTDSSNGQPMAYANVVLRGTSLGASTNSVGYFHIASIPSGRYTLVVSYLGYHTQLIPLTIEGGKTVQVNIRLAPSVIETQEMIVVGERPERLNEPDLGMQKISAQDIAIVPPGVEPDIFRTLQMSPSVGATSDISARYFVRGGGSDQNLVLLNGATLYSPFHTLGIFSVVDPEMVSLLEFHKGGFPPSYGGRLSSILNVVTRDGNRNEFHGVGSASLLSGKVAVEGPIPSGSFLVTGRKSWYADVMKKYLNNRDAPFDFYDFSWKISSAEPSIDRNSRFAFHGFFSGDQVKNDDPFREDYLVRNRILGLNWHKIWSNPLYSIVSVSISGFDAEVMPKLSPTKPRKNKLSDFTADWDFTYVYDSRDELNFGLQNKFLSTTLELENTFGNRISFDQSGWDVNAYVDYRFYRWESIGITIGIRFKFEAISEYRPLLYEPRASFTYRMTPSISLKAAFGWYSQELLTLSDENELISVFEPWIITPTYLNSAQATHLSLGAKVYWVDDCTTEFEVYYKPIRDLIDENEEKFMATDRDFINVDGESYGVEFLSQYEPQRLHMKFGYALTWAHKMKDGVRYYPRYDARHAVNALMGVDLGSGWQASATWVLRSGMPFTPIAGFYDRVTVNPWSEPYDYVVPEAVTLWGKRNSSRLPYYHRLDLSLIKQFHLGGAAVAFGANVVNAYDQKNIFYFNRDTGEEVYMLRILPSVSLKVEL
ncbi:MAG: TonB-dependent receptor [Ignavibacteriales bacterium]|nr:TonB-dependent receptor [Ignavibacteriales bacterium]